MSLTFEEIMQASPLPVGSKTTSVEVPHWGGSITLRKLNADEFITWNARFEKMADPNGNITSRAGIGAAMLCLVAMTALDGDGRQLFDTAEKVEKLNSDFEALTILGAAALAFNRREAPAPKNEQSTPSPNSE